MYYMFALLSLQHSYPLVDAVIVLLLLVLEKRVDAVPLKQPKGLEGAPHQGIEVLSLPPGVS